MEFDSCIDCLVGFLLLFNSGDCSLLRILRLFGKALLAVVFVGMCLYVLLYVFCMLSVRGFGFFGMSRYVLLYVF